MRLKKLELLGFKSFADKTEVLFDRGVTCIVGPNGCGKSNVSDAIRWVLGERSAKLLRGSTMEDVIFNGTEVRKSLAFAEVSLTVDNTDRGMPIEYNQVTLTRRLYRTGESEYLINKTVCRLKDIQDLILDTGIGSSSYSMIEQGRIDYILKADPEERRFLIEEAAGIAKYKVKKDESIRKLERTEDNLKRLQDIVFEVQRNIQYAERQAKRAEKYKLELERLKTLEIKRAFFDRSQIEQRKQDLVTSFQGKKDALTTLEQTLQEQHLAIEGQEAKVRALGQRCHVKEGERYQCLSQIESNDQKLQFIRDKKVELAQQRGQILQEQDQLKQSLEAAAAKKTEISEQSRQLEAEGSQVQSRLTDVSNRLQCQEIAIQDAKAELELVRSKFFEAAQAASHARNEFHRLKALGENLVSQKRREESNAGRFQEQVAVWTERLRLCMQSLDVRSTELRTLTSDHTGLENRIQVMEAELTTLRQQDHDTKLLLREKQSRLQTLLELEQIGGASFREFLNDAAQQLPGLVRELKEIVKIQSGYEWAVDIALGHFARSVIAGDVATAGLLIESLQAKRSLTAGILIKTDLQSQPLPDETRQTYAGLGFRPITEVLSVEAGYDGVLGSFLQGVFIADQFPLQGLGQLLNLPVPGDLVTKDGLILNAFRQLFFWDDQNRSEFIFSREKEMASLRQEVERLQEVILEKENSMGQISLEIAARRLDATGFSEKKTGFLLERESLESEKKSVEERLQALQKELDWVNSEMSTLIHEAAQVSHDQEQCQVLLAQREHDEKMLAEHQQQKEQVLARLTTEREELLNQLRNHQAQAEQCQQGLRHLQESLRLVEHHTQQDLDRQIFLQHGQERIAAKELELGSDEGSCAQFASDYQQKLRAIDVDLELLHKDQREQEAFLGSQRQSLDEMLRTQKALQDEEHQISLQQLDLDYQMKNVGERLLQRYRLKLEDLNPQDYVFTEEEKLTIEETVAALQAKVDSLGTVNLLAIEEYQELKQRYDFLLAQQKDLEDARASLMETIRKINQTTKQLFEDTFALVQQTFKQYYQTLFCGGDARIFLIDETHPLESGIDIVVRPPGKKLQNMSLLSGGEKALTAVALLFALFKIKPSPFCLLDEVDAPLDEANIDRFLTVLRSFLDLSQFIIITHNRKTIAMGDSLYGVTMEEAGVSKIVSVKVRSGEESLPGGTTTLSSADQTPDTVAA